MNWEMLEEPKTETEEVVIEPKENEQDTIDCSSSITETVENLLNADIDGRLSEHEMVRINL